MAARSRWLVGSSSTSRLAPPGHQQREVGAGALARRQGADRAQHVVGAEAELRQQRAGLGLVLPGGGAERLDQRRVGVEGPAHLVDLADDDAAAEPGPTRRQRQPAEQRGRAASTCPSRSAPVTASRSPRRTARSTGPSRKPPRSTTAAASPATSSGPRVAGSSASRSCHGSRGSSTSSSRSTCRCDPGRRRAPGLRAGDLVRPDVLVRLRRPGPRAGRPRRALPGPLLLPAGPVDQAAALLVVRLEGGLGGGPRPLALLEVRREAAAEHRALPGELVDLEHRGRDPLEERAVVRHDDQAAVAAGEERLQRRQPVERRGRWSARRAAARRPG